MAVIAGDASEERVPPAPSWSAVSPSPRCGVCGQELVGGGSPCPNRWCRRPDRCFSVVFAAGAYRGALARAIRRYKYEGDRRLAPAFAAMLATFVATRPSWFEEFDVITAVPSFTGPGARRPWDPVGTILSELARRLGTSWGVEPDLVVKVAETPGMAGRDWASRQAVARGPLRRALAVPSGVQVAGARILVVDDVLTEGSTLREVAGALHRAGADDVAGLVLARPAWTPERPTRPAM